MPRKPRFHLVGIPQHVIQRGHNREPCFYTEQDYRHYLKTRGGGGGRSRGLSMPH